MPKGIIIRTVTVEECPWLKADVPEGAIVYKYGRFTGPFPGEGNVPVTDVDDTTPAYEIPRDAVKFN